MRMKILSIITATIILLILTITNADAKLSKIITDNPAQLATAQFNPNSRTERIDIAKKLLASVKVFESYLPKLSDTDLKILKEQEDEIDRMQKNILHLNSSEKKNYPI